VETGYLPVIGLHEG